MKNLKVPKDWLTSFHNETIELITTIDNRELFIQTIKGSFPNTQLNYETVFRLIEAFISSYDFLEIEEIRLIWSEGLKKTNLQFYRNINDFSVWKETVIKNNFEIDSSSFGDIEDSSDIFYNYYLNVEGEDILLYNYAQNDRTGIYLWYNPKTNTTNYSFVIEFRKSLFMIDKLFEINLPEDYLEFNNNLKATAEIKMLKKLNE
ncbi:hypothetical protein IUY40_00080 [Flavobacterium sp. ALJ2]|uniref:hypothetical protein n=1 Tax=Flavobacterium sp. ALJ2 TaxID=2786960 RepID=UPI00189CF9E8|nr:hypothetical protein [Flavobacterium sp. ALJ2]MBF7089947.1 hypothetical protein [Flavobacterium sp. ALJ2]